MAVRPAVTKTPQRVTTQYTVGAPDLTLDITTAATSPNVGSLASNPNPVTLVGADAQSGTVAVGALASGASFAFSIKVPFPNLPTPTVIGVSDKATFVVGVTAIRHGIAGLVIGEFRVQTIAYTLGSTEPSLENQLQLNQTYTGWAALVSGTLVAVAATAAGTLTVRVHGTIYDILG